MDVISADMMFICRFTTLPIYPWMLRLCYNRLSRSLMHLWCNSRPHNDPNMYVRCVFIHSTLWLNMVVDYLSLIIRLACYHFSFGYMFHLGFNTSFLFNMEWVGRFLYIDLLIADLDTWYINAFFHYFASIINIKVRLTKYGIELWRKKLIIIIIKSKVEYDECDNKINWL